MPTLEWFPPALLRLREVRGLSQTAVAERAGISKSMLSSYENGKQFPSLGTLMKILHALDSNLVELQAAMVASREGRLWTPRKLGSASQSALAGLLDGVADLAHEVAEELRAELGVSAREEAEQPR